VLVEFVEFVELIESVENAENVENDDDDDDDGENSMPVNVDRPNTNTPLVAGTVNAGAVGGAKTNAELDCTTGRVGRDISLPAIAGVVGTAESKADRGGTAPVNRGAPPLAALRLARARRRSC
jgi:hypothetical protein